MRLSKHPPYFGLQCLNPVCPWGRALDCYAERRRAMAQELREKKAGEEGLG